MFKRLLTDSIAIVFGNLETVFKTCGAWFALQFVLSLVVLMIGGDISGEAQVGNLSGTAVLLILISAVVALAASASIAVAWHRFGLLGEQPATFHLKLGPLELQFVWKLIQLFFISMLVLIPVMIVVSLLGMALPPVVGALLAAGLLLFWIMPHLVRLNLVLPAVAIERPIGIMDAHRLGNGLGWRMLWSLIVLSLPFLLVSMGLQYVLALAGASLPVVLIQIKVLILNVLLQIIVTVLGISVITAGYRIATEQPEVSDNPEMN